MNLATQIVFWVPYLGTSLVLLILLYFYLVKRERFHSFLKLALFLIIGFFLISWLGQILILYLAIKASPYSQELLQGTKSFFYQKTVNISLSFLLTVLVTAIIYVGGLLAVKFQKRPILENFVPTILILFALSLNFSNILPAILAAFLLALIYQLILLLCRKPTDRLSIVPFLLIACFLVHVLMLFPFYSTLLGILHLI